MKDNKGFSLVELIIVIAIMAAIAGAIFYSYMLLIGQYPRECANNLSTSMDKAKNYALVRSASVDCYMELVKNNKGYSVKYYVPKNAKATGHDVDSGAFQPDDWELAEELNIGKKMVHIKCEYYQGSSKAGYDEITDSNSVKLVYNRISGALKGIGDTGSSDHGLDTIDESYTDVVITISYGRDYEIHLYTATGKHVLSRVG